ncbi:DUF6470 family protein [Paenibacillus sp. MSJ-34]|uniref:DUF6470 family protein n=1 Tax=Paenibacillus sp. MSJ-34 TaxID=2841529 RepID=UPI001C10484A|nr:DUF6470 family protein [Paenibacillus sp. MSJ-34]MBU5440983.1 hypothetical protein [Paenibacillus sp. MSJ-34]
MINSISNGISVRPPLHMADAPVRKIEIYETDARYVPAELYIKTRSAEMETDWTHVWEDLGLLRPSTVAREIAHQEQGKLMDNVAQKARDGDRIANISSKEKSVFGNIATERYMRQGQANVQLVAAPSQGVFINFRIYAPEIHVEVRGGPLK